MIELAIKMDIDGDEDIMQTENAYFDATHSRVHGFKSFGLWVYHPSMWRMKLEVRIPKTLPSSLNFSMSLLQKFPKQKEKCAIQELSCVMKVGLITKQLE